jgi:hypothetical protein
MTVLESHLQQLARELNLNEAPSKEGQVYSFPINSKTMITIKELLPQGAYLSAPICPYPKGSHEDLLIYLMKANFLGQGTLGGIIGLDKDENFLTLSFNLPYDMNYRHFREAVEDFANILDYWKGEIEQFLKGKKGV